MLNYYGAGNMKVLKHIRRVFVDIGVPPERVVFIERYPGYSASKEID